MNEKELVIRELKRRIVKWKSEPITIAWYFQMLDAIRRDTRWGKRIVRNTIIDWEATDISVI